MCTFNELDKSLFSSIYVIANSGVSEAIFILRDEKVVWANDRAASLLGLNTEEMVGKYLFELIPVLKDVSLSGDEVKSIYYGDLFLEIKVINNTNSSFKSEVIVIIKDISEFTLFRRKRIILDNIYALNEAIERLKTSRM